MEELKKYCTACGEEKDIVLVEIDESKGKIELECGHRIFFDEITEITEDGICLSESLKIKIKRANEFKISVEQKIRDKISKGTKRPAREILIIDKERKVKIHRVWEKDQKGEWVSVHEEEIPFEEMLKNSDKNY